MMWMQAGDGRAGCTCGRSAAASEGEHIARKIQCTGTGEGARWEEAAGGEGYAALATSRGGRHMAAKNRAAGWTVRQAWQRESERRPLKMGGRSGAKPTQRRIERRGQSRAGDPAAVHGTGGPAAKNGALLLRQAAVVVQE